MANEATTLELVLKLRSEGRFEEATAALEQLKRQAEEISEAGFKAGEALEKLGDKGGLTNTGSGLASDPAAFFAAQEAAQQRAIQLTGEAITKAEQLTTRLREQIQIKKVLGESTEKEAAALQKLNAALAPARAEQERAAKVLGDLKHAQDEDTKSTEDATKKKDELRQVVQGLGGAQLGQLGTTLRALTSVWGGLTAAVGLAVNVLKNYSDTVMTAGQAAQVFSNLQQRTETLATTMAQLAVASDAFEASFARIVAAATPALQVLNEINAAMLLQQQLENKASSAELANELDRIANDKSLSPAQRNQALFAAQQAERKRQQDAEETNQTNAASRERVFADNARRAAAEAKAAADAMQPEVAAAAKAAKDAQTEIGDSGTANAPRAAQNARLIEFAKMIEGGGMGAAGLKALHPGLSKEFMERFGNMDPAQAAQEMEDEQKSFAQQRQMAELNAANKQRAAAALAAEQKRLQDMATKNATDAANADTSANARTRVIETGRQFQPRINAAVDALGQRQADRATKDQTVAELTAKNRELVEALKANKMSYQAAVDAINQNAAQIDQIKQQIKARGTATGSN
jgi:hypothetical protein